jgi:hypothetical protein
MKNRKISLKCMTDYKNKQAEKTQQQECIKDLR